MIYAFIIEQCADLPVVACCSVLGVSRTGFYQRKPCPVTDRERAEADAANLVHDIWSASRRAYGAPRIRAEARLGRGIRWSKTTCERLMKIAGVQGIFYPAKPRRRSSDGAEADFNPDLVARAFDPEGPDRLWCMDITEHPTGEGTLYLAVVIDAWARRVVGHSIADHLRAEIVADALQMATWRRDPEPKLTIAHSDHGPQYTSWLLGQRLRAAGILGSMGSVGDALDNSVAEAFFSILQRELLDQHRWSTKDQLANAMFEWIECWYNPTRRHSYNDHLSPVEFEAAHAA